MRAAARHWVVLSAGAVLVIGISMTTAVHGATLTPANPAQSQAAGDTGAQGQPMLDMVAAQAELKDSINAKKLKDGEMIRARISEKLKFSNGKELPVDTILEGHVDQVQPSEKKSDSMVVVTFDKARLKGGEELPIKATLLSMWEPQEAVSGGMGSGAPLPGGQMSQSGGRAGLPSQTNVMSEGRQPVPGVKLHSDIHEKNSATFTAERQDVNVPSGTEMRFGLVVIPPGMHLQP
ncbi:MAG TPA: hypothetical protein VFE06_18915 [Acidobacteriaceae bacterium]|nr:hypothetical protein [Acidobacteriaceae bacterium]